MYIYIVTLIYIYIYTLVKTNTCKTNETVTTNKPYTMIKETVKQKYSKHNKRTKQNNKGTKERNNNNNNDNNKRRTCSSGRQPPTGASQAPWWTQAKMTLLPRSSPM